MLNVSGHKYICEGVWSLSCAALSPPHHQSPLLFTPRCRNETWFLCLCLQPCPKGLQLLWHNYLLWKLSCVTAPVPDRYCKSTKRRPGADRGGAGPVWRRIRSLSVSFGCWSSGKRWWWAVASRLQLLIGLKSWFCSVKTRNYINTASIWYQRVKKCQIRDFV